MMSQLSALEGPHSLLTNSASDTTHKLVMVWPMSPAPPLTATSE